ncbi:hypothetical protein BGZ63DRAFT_389376 [Mariannaea sp. PMI_226]|nr:hypothetical protein BGZ63DRAFT_389376 [Mariannaea sp. PMI_226]
MFLSLESLTCHDECRLVNHETSHDLTLLCYPFFSHDSSMYLFKSCQKVNSWCVGLVFLTLYFVVTVPFPRSSICNHGDKFQRALYVQGYHYPLFSLLSVCRCECRCKQV